MINAQTFFLAGHARLPQGTSNQNVYDSITITVEIDGKYGVILDASCTLITQLGRDYVSRILIGHSFKDGIDEIIQGIQLYYRGRAASALIAALKDVQIQYEKVRLKK